MCVFEAPGEAGVYIAVLNLDLLRTHRNNDVMGDKYRRPEKYGILSEEKYKVLLADSSINIR